MLFPQFYFMGLIIHFVTKTFKRVGNSWEGEENTRKDMDGAATSSHPNEMVAKTATPGDRTICRLAYYGCSTGPPQTQGFGPAARADPKAEDLTVLHKA
jgi:hypothetical protein